MRTIQQTAMAIASIGLAASFVLHCMAWFGMVPGGVWWLWALNIGIFAVIVPSMIFLGMTKRNDVMKVVLAACPVWMKWTFYGLIAYVISHYLLSVLNHPGVRPRTGDASPFSLRLTSGHWMIFYAATVCLLYSALNAPHLLRRRECPVGHKAAVGAQSCEECGYVFPEMSGKD